MYSYKRYGFIIFSLFFSAISVLQAAGTLPPRGEADTVERSNWCKAKYDNCMKDAKDACLSGKTIDDAVLDCEVSEGLSCRNSFGSTSNCKTRPLVMNDSIVVKPASGQQVLGTPGSGATNNPQLITPVINSKQNPTVSIVAPVKDTSNPAVNNNVHNKKDTKKDAEKKKIDKKTDEKVDKNDKGGFKNCGKATVGFWECFKGGKKYYCTGKGTGCVIVRATTKPPIIEKQNTGNRVYTPTTSPKPLEETSQGWKDNKGNSDKAKTAVK